MTTTSFYKVADATILATDTQAAAVLTYKFGGSCPLNNGTLVTFLGTAVAVQPKEGSRYQAALAVKLGSEETYILLATLRRTLQKAADGLPLKGVGDCSDILQQVGLDATEVAAKLKDKTAMVSITEAIVTKTRFADGVSYNTLGRVYNLSFK